MTRRTVLACFALALATAPAEAQNLRNRITDLFTFGDCGEPLCLDLTNEHGDHFLPAVTQGEFTVIGFVTEAIGKSVSSLPVSSTSSGATFAIVGGLPVRTSTSAGPIFGERAQTLGRGRFFLGANVSGIHFTSISGVPLEDVTINFAHANVLDSALGNPGFEVDLIQLRLALDVDVSVATIFMTWGMTDFIDVGVAVPFVRTSVNGASEAQILPFGTGATPVHFFAGTSSDPVLRAASSVSGSASGVGDVVGRLKINLGQSSKFGAAILGEIRFPSGNERQLLGAGATAVRGLGIASAQFGSFSPHLNVGYQARTAELQNDAVLATLGFDNLLTDWATFAFDLVSEWQVGDSKLPLPGDIVYDEPFTRRIPSVSIPDRRDNIVNATAGMKFTVRGGTVIVLNGILPLREVGLQPDFVWTAGLEFAF